MSSRSVEKFGALVFSVLMVTSMFVGVVALSADSAEALPPSTLSNDQTSDAIVVPGESEEVANLTFTDPGNVRNVTVDLAGGTDSANLTGDDVSAVEVILEDSSGTVLASQLKTGNGLVRTVDFGSNVTGVSRVVIRATASQFGAENGDTFDAGNIAIQDDESGTTATSTTNVADTAGTQVVESDTGARLRGEVLFQNGTIADNVTVQVVDTDTGAVVRDDIETRGFDTNQPGTWGPLVFSPGNYTVELDDTGTTTSDLLGEVEVFSTVVNLERGETEKIETTLDPLNLPARIVAEDDQVFVGENATLTVTVFDEDGNEIEGANVFIAGREGSPTPTVINNGTKVTDANGQVEFNVTSPSIAVTAFNFTTERGDTSPPPSDIGVATFIQSGEGDINGQVYNRETTDTVENASVWAVSDDRFSLNTRQTVVDLSPFDDDDSTVWVRLVDNETGEIIDKDLYDVRATEQFGNDGTGIRKVALLNESENEEGSGFAVNDSDGLGVVVFNHTRLSPREYRVQVSFNAGNASDDRVAEDQFDTPVPRDDETEFFVNVTGLTAIDNDTTQVSALGGAFFDGDPTNDPVTYEPEANLTLDRTKELASIGGDDAANLVDAPGHVNSFGVDTAGTNENGDFALSQLFTDFQDGRQYVVIGTKAGLTTDFADVFQSEDGDLEFSEFENQYALQLERDPVDVNVNVTNLARLPAASFAPDPANRSDPGAYSEFYFDNQTDRFEQPLTRDGEEIDVLLLETTDERTGESVNDSVTLSVPDTLGDAPVVDGGDAATEFNFAGDFIAVAGGEILRQDTVNNTITVATDDDGQAIVWLRMDVSTLNLRQIDPDSPFYPDVPDDLADCTVIRNDDGEIVESFFSGVVAQSQTDVTEIDSTCKVFGGVTQVAQISGIVTDQDNDPLENAVVWVDSFSLAAKNTGVEITQVGPRQYRVDIYNSSLRLPQNLVASETVSQSALQDDFRFEDFFDPTLVERRGLTPFEVSGFTLLTTAGEAEGNRGEYTLPRVPATATPNDYSVTARFQGETGQGDARELRAGRTDDANVVIREINVTGAFVTINDQSGNGNSATVSAFDLGDVGTAVSVWTFNTTTASPEEFLGAVQPSSEEGQDVEIVFDSGSIGENTTIVAAIHNGDPSSADTIVSSGGDLAVDTAFYTLSDGSGGDGDLASQYDNDGDGTIDEIELLQVIEDFNTGEIDDPNVVLSVIAEFNGDAQWADV